MRWQMELLSYDLQEEGGVLDQSLRSFDSVSKSADRLSLAAENAPEDIRTLITTTVDEIDQVLDLLPALVVQVRSGAAA